MINRGSAKTKPVDLKTEVRIGFQELTQSELTLLTKTYNLKRDSHKFVKMMVTSPNTSTVNFMYQIKKKTPPTDLGLVGGNPSGNAAARSRSGSNTGTPKRLAQNPDQSQKPVLEITVEDESSRPVVVGYSPNLTSNKSATVSKPQPPLSGKSSATSNKSKAKDVVASPKANKAVAKAKVVAKQVKAKETTEPTANPFETLNVFKAAQDETSQLSKSNTSLVSAGFNDVGDLLHVQHHVRLSDSTVKNFSFGNDLNQSVAANILEPVDPGVLSRVRRTVELLSELHNSRPADVVKMWLELKNLDRVKLHLAQQGVSYVA